MSTEAAAPTFQPQIAEANNVAEAIRAQFGSGNDSKAKAATADAVSKVELPPNLD